MPLGAIVLTGSWFVLLAVLGLDLAGILRRGTGFRWQATGLLIENTAVDASVFAHDYSWTGGLIGALRPATFPLILAGSAIFVVGLVIQYRKSPS